MTDITGHGEIHVNGGNAHSIDVSQAGGGGAGGRISVQATNLGKFNVTMTAYGGQ